MCREYNGLGHTPSTFPVVAQVGSGSRRRPESEVVVKALSRFLLVLFALCLLPFPALADGSPQQQEVKTTAGAAEPAPQEQEEGSDEVEDPNDFRIFWRDGFRAETNDGRFQLRLGARLQTDFNWILEKEPFDGAFGTLENSMEVRRARLYVQGYMWERVEYKFEVDFAGGTVGAKDMYLGVRGWPVTARFGHMKEPFSIEELTSSRFITFMERSLVNMFSPARNTGLMVLGNFNDRRSTWGVGVFRSTDGFASSTGDNYDITGRLTHAAVSSDDSRSLLHVGVNLQHKRVDGNLRLSTRPGDHNAPRVLEVNIPASSANYVSLEASANIGSLGLQAEYLSAWVKSEERDDPHLSGYYLQGSFFFTGETRPYDRGRFVRLSPDRNFPGGPGAWELALRYARVDLTEGLEEGPGELWNLTTGLNWYWNPNVRFMLNHEYSKLADLDTTPFSILHMRLMFDF